MRHLHLFCMLAIANTILYQARSAQTLADSGDCFRTPLSPARRCPFAQATMQTRGCLLLPQYFHHYSTAPIAALHWRVARTYKLVSNRHPVPTMQHRFPSLQNIVSHYIRAYSLVRQYVLYCEQRLRTWHALTPMPDRVLCASCRSPCPSSVRATFS